MVTNSWQPMPGFEGWVRHDGPPTLLVNVAAIDTPDALQTVLVELVAREASEAQLGALVLMVTEPKLDAIRASGEGRWSGAVVFVPMVEIS
jgi:hypothetical protein